MPLMGIQAKTEKLVIPLPYNALGSSSPGLMILMGTEENIALIW